MQQVVDSMDWDQDALQAVAKAPALLRGMVKKRVEAYVSSMGLDKVTLGDVEEARSRAGRAAKPGDEFGGLSCEEVEKLVARAASSVASDSRFYEVTICGGAHGCPRSLVDVSRMAERVVDCIESSGLPEVVAQRVSGPVLRHHKFTVSISGCPNSCSQPQIQDFGLQGRVRVGVGDAACTGCMACVDVCREGTISIAASYPTIDHLRCINCADCEHVCPTGTLVREAAGYTVLMGGKLGRHPQLAREIAEFFSDDDATRALRVAIDIFTGRMNPGERMADAVTRLGVDEILSMIAKRP